MRTMRLWILVACCVLATAMFLIAQPQKHPGLYETTSTMTWQQSPLPPGMQLPPGVQSPFSGSTHTAQVCITQEMIDRFGGPAPQTRQGCQLASVVKTAGGMTASLVCTGMMSGKGTVESSWSEGGTSKSKLHFTGAMQMGQRSTPVEWTVESTSTFKGPDCGDVKPIQIPPQ